MNRRTFFKKAATVVGVGVCAAPLLIDAIKSKSHATPLSDAERECLIAKALETDEGRTALAKAMIEPIRDQVEWGRDGLPCSGHDFNTMTKAELRKKYAL